MARNLRKFKNNVLDVQMADCLSGPFARTAVSVLLCSAFLVSNVQAAMSGESGTIEGRAPTAVGSLFVAAPNGSVVQNNEVADNSWVPDKFSASADTTDLTLSDLDGDCDSLQSPCTVTVDVAAATSIWKFNGEPLDDEMLKAPLKNYFSGKALTVSVSAPVTTTSITGSPTSGTQTLASIETMLLVPMEPGIYVGATVGGSYHWGFDKGFPTTGAKGLQFRVNLAGSNGIAQTDFNWSTNQPSWTKVDSEGLVTFTGVPTSATKTVTITATSKVDSAIKTPYTFTMKKWFASRVLNGAVRVYPTLLSSMNQYCSSGSLGRAAQALQDVTLLSESRTTPSGFREVSGRIAREWGETLFYANPKIGNNTAVSTAQVFNDGHMIVTSESPIPDALKNENVLLEGSDVYGHIGLVIFPQPGTTFAYSSLPAAPKYRITADGWVPLLGANLNTYTNSNLYNQLCVKDL